MERNDFFDFKAIGGIDSLYFFADISGDNYNKIYDEYIVNEKFFDGFEFIGYSGKATGFVGSWFSYSIKSNIKYNGRFVDVKLFRVGFKNPNKQKNVKNVYIQLYAEGIYYLGLEELLQYIDELFTSYGLVPNDYYVSRADINVFVNYDFSFLDKDMFRVPTRRVEVHNNQDLEIPVDTKSRAYFTNRLETLYFGSRSSDINLKIYDKYKELTDGGLDIKAIIMKTYLESNGLSFDNPLWNVEFSLKRKALLQYGVNTIVDLLSVAGSIFKDLMSKYVLLDGDLELIRKHRKSGHLNRLKVHPIWEFISCSYGKYSYFPVIRSIKSYKSNIINNRYDTILVALMDLVYNTSMPLDHILYNVRRFYLERAGLQKVTTGR